MFALRNFRLAAFFVSLLAALTLVGVTTARARMGGSFGSRGMRTHQTVPHTQAVPRPRGRSPIRRRRGPRRSPA